MRRVRVVIRKPAVGANAAVVYTGIFSWDVNMYVWRISQVGKGRGFIAYKIDL